VTKKKVQKTKKRRK